jgi:hypothetical protein
MTVAELILILKELPQDLPVTVDDAEHGAYEVEAETVFEYPEGQPTAVNIG